jgi:hypothetical protein
LWRERCGHSTSARSTFGAVSIGGIYFHANRAMQACVSWSQQLASTTTAILKCNDCHEDVHPAVASLPVAAKSPGIQLVSIRARQRFQSTMRDGCGTECWPNRKSNIDSWRTFRRMGSVETTSSGTGAVSKIVSGSGAVEQLTHETLWHYRSLSVAFCS